MPGLVCVARDTAGGVEAYQVWLEANHSYATPVDGSTSLVPSGASPMLPDALSYNACNCGCVGSSGMLTE